MPSLNQSAAQHLASEIDALRRENEALLHELETAYAQLTAVLQVSQDETRIAYSELQEKLVVQEKKLVELGFLSSAGDALLGESDLTALCRLVVEKICLILPIDLVLLRLSSRPEICTQRERDLVRESRLERPQIEALATLARRLESEGRSTLLVPDLDAEPGAAALRLRPDARSAACLPLRSARRQIGVLVLNSRLRANFRDDQEPLLAAFAHQAAAALANALRWRRYEDVLVRCLAAHDVGAADLERCADAPQPSPAEEAQLRQALHRSLATSDHNPAAGTDPRPSETEVP